MRPSSKAAGLVLALVLLVGLIVAVDRLGLGGAQPETATTASATAVPPSASPSRQSARDPETGLRWVALTSLPREAQQTVILIDRGGPFPYDKDGVTFGNRERVLPDQPRGFYREYTVRTPGERDRGARRIVTGDQDQQLFYTGDHYATFARVRR